MHPGIEFAHKLDLAYAAACKPLCQALGLPQTAFDILLFLANNPDCRTAADIVELRRLKPNLVSVNIDKLVQLGYLTRGSIAGDRRKTLLQCTPAAGPIIEKGRQMQAAFGEMLVQGTTPQMREEFQRTTDIMHANLDKFLAEELLFFLLKFICFISNASL